MEAGPGAVGRLFAAVCADTGLAVHDVVHSAASVPATRHADRTLIAV
jgi:hypothetical protein